MKCKKVSNNLVEVYIDDKDVKNASEIMFAFQQIEKDIANLKKKLFNLSGGFLQFPH